MNQTAIKLIRLIIFLALLASFVPKQDVNAAGLCYVNSNAVSGTNNGTSWSNAYINLQSALADTCTEIWVAAGTYKPHASDRSISFALETGVAIYGGFDGTETLHNERDYLSNVTTLSGDLLGNDTGFTNNNENSYHVVIGSGTNNTAILDGFTITGGNANTYPGLTGGGVYNFAGNPTLANIKITGNTATDKGGGIDNINSNPSLTNITVSGNTSYDGGGMSNWNSSPTLLNALFSGNSASDSGGAINNEYNSNITITDSNFTNNSAQNSGGGMHNNLQSNPSLTNISFTNNTAAHGGGLSNINESNPSLTNVSFSTNTATFEGGGMYNSNSSPVLTNVTFINNQAPNLFGGGIYSWMTSNPVLTGVVFKNNSALRGGGMYVDHTGVAEITNTTFESNTATQDGGGFYNSGTSTIINSTFYGNSVTREGGAIYNAGTLTITNNTVSNSSAADGGGIFNLGALNYSNTLIANTSAGGDCFSFPAILTNITNLVEDGSCAAALTGDPLLGSLANNGGSTQTMALLTGSPAIDAGTNTGCPTTDQRGVARPQGIHCDIGAYEYQNAPPTTSSITRASTSPTSASSVDFTVTFSEDVTGVDANGSDFELFTTGVTGASITGVTPVSASVYTVSVNSGSGNGTIRLDLIDDDSIEDLAGNKLGGTGAGNGTFISDSDETYSIFKLPPKPVSAPKPSQPRWKSITNNSTPTFVWSSVPNAVEYELVIAADSSFSQIVLTGNVTSPSFTPSDPLGDGKYFWRVRAYNAAAQPGKFSISQIFTIDTTAPAAPLLTVPMNNATFKSSPVFRWNRVDGAVSYEFQYDNDADVSSPTYSVMTPNIYRKPPAMPNGTFFWRVRAQDAAGNWSDWSIIRSVTISR